jgi:cellulose synthase/poly-beta-1,6-N-acetylglucosamine synthase-like glycosyltransferase
MNSIKAINAGSKRQLRMEEIRITGWESSGTASQTKKFGKHFREFETRRKNRRHAVDETVGPNTVIAINIIIFIYLKQNLFHSIIFYYGQGTFSFIKILTVSNMNYIFCFSCLLIITLFHDNGIIIIIIITERCSRVVRIPAPYSGALGLNLRPEACYSDSGFCGFRQFFQTNVGIRPPIRPRSVSSTHILIHRH